MKMDEVAIIQFVLKTIVLYMIFKSNLKNT